MHFARQKMLFAILLAFLMSTLVSFLPTVSAEAAITQMPNPADFSQGSHVRLVVSRYNKSAGTLLAAPFSAVKLYSKDRTATVTVHNAGCGDTGGPKNPDYGGVVKTRFRMIATTANGVKKDGGGARSDVKDKGCNDGGAITLRATARTTSEYSDRAGYYVFYIEAQAIGGSRGWNAFNLSSNNTGAIFSYYANDNYRFAMKADNNTGRGTFNLKFAPKCSATNDKNASLNYFDADVGQSNQGYDSYIDTVLHINPAVNGSPFSGGKWRITNSGNQGPNEPARSIQFAFLKDHKYQWTWKSIHEDNGIQFALPGDYIDYALNCPPPPTSTGWQLQPTSEPVATQKVKFDYTAVPDGVDKSSDAPKPNESSHTYSPGMDCSVYTNTTNKNRCIERNKYHARKVAVDKNITEAKKALKPVKFRHYIKNIAPPSNQNLKHVTAPRNKSNKLGCSSGDTLSTYCARIQYMAKGGAGSWESDWWFRAPNERESDGNTMTNAFSANINKNQKKRAMNTAGGWSQTISSIVDTDKGPVYTLLNRSGGPRMGDQVCERLAVRKGHSWKGSTDRVNSAKRCVELSPESTPPEDGYYDITPNIFGSGVVEQGSNIAAIGTFRIPAQDEDGDYYTASKANTRWQISRFTLGENESLGDLDGQSDIDENKDGCAFIKSQDLGSDCTAAASGQESFPVNAHANEVTPKLAPTFSTANLPIGAQVCFMASVSTPTEASTPVWRHSAVNCFAVTKKPKVRFNNGDVRAGRNFLSTNAQGAITCSAPLVTSKIKTARGINANATSRVEYGAFATDKITDFGSANTGYSATASDFGKLTFGNATATGSINANNFGRFTFPLSCFGDKDYFYYAKQSNPTSVPGDKINAGQSKGVYIKEGPSSANGEDGSSGAFEIDGGTVTNNPVVIYAKKNGAGAGGDIKITNNITYPDNFGGNIANLPKLIILADGDVTIADNVSRVDAWIITKGTLETCDTSGELTKEDCKDTLQINGPVMVNKIGLYRTHGSDLTETATQYSPAEIFNLRPDQILNTYTPKDSGGSGVDWQTVFEKSLPPRY